MTDHRRALQIRGRAHVIGDDINTDYIIASRYKARATDVPALAQHIFEDLDAGLAARIQHGDIIVAGDNFGSGSSRETAPRVLRAAGISAVVARSFARIFFRNSINVGLPVIETDWSDIGDGDTIHIDTGRGEVRGLDGTRLGTFTPLPEFLHDILMAGGVREFLRRER